jgi:transcription initiation factor IIE alpha subunit
MRGTIYAEKGIDLAVMTKTKDIGLAGTLTVDDLTRAIKNSIDRSGMREEEARQMAQHVMNFFGYSERIIDNILEPEDRDAFYMLEDSGLLTTEREETTLYDGREWRIHYWLFRKEKIIQLVKSAKSKKALQDFEPSIYDEVPEDIWAVREGELGEE